MNDFEKIPSWLIANGYEILAQKYHEDGRLAFAARKIYKPGFVKKGGTEIKNLRIAAVVETESSMQSSGAIDHMRRMQLWKGIDNSSEKWLLFFAPELAITKAKDLFYGYDQFIGYPLDEDIKLGNEPKESPLGIKGWNP